MSEREYKPGEVWPCAAAHGPSGDGGEVVYVMARARRGWSIVDDPDYYWSDSGVTVRPIRALALVDPNDGKALDRLAALLWPHYAKNELVRLRKSEIIADALREFADPKPPKPDEPTGLGAVVEAAFTADDGKGFGPAFWARAGDGSWLCLADGMTDVSAPWGFLTDVTVHCTGVSR